MKMSIKTYSELISLPTFIDRFNYLKLSGSVGVSTFGYNRYLNQILYNSDEWKKFRRDMFIRDEARDLACEGFDIFYRPTLHHINPITVEDVLNRRPCVFDPENVITTTHNTHNAIHYGDASKLIITPTIRTKNDTCPWKH